MSKTSLSLYLEVVDEVVRVVVDPDEGVERLEVPAVLRRHSLPRHDEVGARRRPYGRHSGVVRVNLTPWRIFMQMVYLCCIWATNPQTCGDKVNG